MLKKELFKRLIIITSVLTLTLSSVTYANETLEEVVEETSDEETKEATEDVEEEESEEKEDENTEEDLNEEDSEESEDDSDYSMSDEEELEEDFEETEDDLEEDVSEEQPAEDPSLKNPYEQPEEEQTEVERLRWDISKGQERTKTFDIPVPQHTVRMEFFYSARVPAPIYRFRSTYGSTYGSNTSDTYIDGDFKFVKRTGLSISDYSDIKYDVVYISNPPDTGKWDLTITLDDDETEFFALSSSVPTNWETLNQDYKTNPIEMLTWAIDSEQSSYKASDIINIIAKEAEPTQNKIQDTPAPEVEPFFTPLRIAVASLSVIIVAAVLLILKTRKDTKEKTTEIQKRRIEKANSKFSQIKKVEDDSLEDYMSSFDGEYNDEEEDDIENYFSSEDAELKREEEKIQETRSNPEWLKEDIDEVLSKIDKEDKAMEVPSWMPQKEVKQPSWMELDSQNTDPEDEGGFF